MEIRRANLDLGVDSILPTLRHRVLPRRFKTGFELRPTLKDLSAVFDVGEDHGMDVFQVPPRHQKVWHSTHQLATGGSVLDLHGLLFIADDSGVELELSWDNSAGAIKWWQERLMAGRFAF